VTNAPPGLVGRFLGWLGTLSVSRKLTLIYLLDLTAVIYISGILIHEKYLAIDFARKEIVGANYTDAVRQVMMSSALPAAGHPGESGQSLQRLAQARAVWDPDLGTVAVSPQIIETVQVIESGTSRPADSVDLSPLFAQGRALVTAVGNQSNLILDPDLDSYYVMSLTVLRYPELLQVMHETMEFLKTYRSEAFAGQDQRTRLLILAGRIEAVAEGVRADAAQATLAGSPQLQAALRPVQLQLDEQLGGFIRVIRQMVDQPVTADESRMLDATYTGVLQALGTSWTTGLTQLNQLLQARVDGQFSRMWLHLGTALLLLGCILSLVYVVAQQIARPLKNLALVAGAVRRTGEYTRRAQWHSKDEIGQLVTAFNDMLAQLDQDRLTQQEMAASARAAAAQQELLESMPIAMVVTSVPDHDVLHANAPAMPWLGGQRSDPWRNGLEPGVRNRFFQRLADKDSVDEFEVRWLGGEEPSWAVLSARRLTYQGRDAVLTSFTPINVLKLMEQRLELWSKVFEASSESIVIMDETQRILSVNRAFCRSTSYDYYEVVGEQLTQLLDSPDARALIIRIGAAIQERDAWQGEVMVRRRSGDTYPAWLMISAVRESARQGAISHYIGISVDITDRKRTEARVQYLAEHDVLTGLPNRALCVERLRGALVAAELSGERVAVLFIDLDRFKIINDTLGHHIGDGLLRSVATRLSQAVRAGDTVSRLGGDEFVILLRGVKDGDDVREQVDNRLIPLIRQAHHVEGHELSVSCSVGVAICPDDGTDLDELMRRADAAMYEAKSAGRDRARFYVPAIDDVVRQRQTMERCLRGALERGEFRLLYQPRVNAQTREFLGVEALLRWHSEELGLVGPDQFIPIAEETGLIRGIGAWVIDEACGQWALWSKGAIGPVDLSINLSVTQLADSALVCQLQGSLLASGADPARIELEITESQLMGNADAAQQQLASLKALGVKLSIDDFGTGYSSLAYLKRFSIDKLKIDKSFVHDMLEDPTDFAITRAIVALGHTLGLQVVAEGVEREEEARELKNMGCDELQGYLFARPLTADALALWLLEPALHPRRRDADLV
jgi:diguanylate cyclase (GGDEF)-like protein/PAS domain S-box-containing protein